MPGSLTDRFQFLTFGDSGTRALRVNRQGARKSKNYKRSSKYRYFGNTDLNWVHLKIDIPASLDHINKREQGINIEGDITVGAPPNNTCILKGM